jgi:leader peptidase (prepilin peptidase)/N-methyltransferase
MFFSVLIVIAMIDYDTGIIPDRMNIAVAVLALLSLFTRSISWADRLIGLLTFSLPMLILALTCNGFGGGDIKLTAAAGFLLGWKAMLITILISSVCAAIYGIFLMVKTKADIKSKFAFGPWLCLGMMLSSLYTPDILKLMFLA